MKKGLGVLGVLLALVVVLGVGLAGRNVLAARKAEQSAQEPAAAATDAGEGASTTSSDVPLLKDNDATVYTDLGEPQLLTEIANGRPLVINFWATWCPYCVDEMPDYQAIYAEYHDRVSFAFVDVADGRSERVEDARKWLEEQGYTELPAFYDTDLEATSIFGAYALPTTVVVSASGEVLANAPGRIDAAWLRGMLNTLV